MTDETFSIIAFTIHSILFVLMLVFISVNPSFLNNSTYVNILYILLSTLLIHGGYQLGKERSSKS